MASRPAKPWPVWSFKISEEPQPSCSQGRGGPVQKLPSMLAGCPTWFLEALLMPYAHTTEAFYCQSRGT